MLFVLFVSLHIVVAQVAGRAQLVAFHVLYHTLAIELLDDEFIVLRVWVNTSDSVVGNPNRIVAVLGINHKVPRTSLVLICNRFQLRVEKRRNLFDDSLDKLRLFFPF